MLTVVVAARDEAAALPLLHPRIAAALARVDGLRTRVLYVDDGSTDDTWGVLGGIAAADPQVALLRLSRNFGKEAALTAGLDQVVEGAAMILDADGQDPPELIPDFVALWRQGFDDVYGTRIAREGEGWLKRATAAAFYRVMRRLSHTPVPADTGDYRLLSPRLLAALRQLRERHRFMKGLFGWVGFSRIALPYRRAPRLAGHSKFGFWRLWNFALEGITGFSTAPLKVAGYLGLLSLLAALATLLAGIFGQQEIHEHWPVIAALFLIGGLQLLAIGVCSEYLGRMTMEARRRPLYLIDRYLPAQVGGANP